MLNYSVAELRFNTVFLIISFFVLLEVLYYKLLNASFCFSYNFFYSVD